MNVKNRIFLVILILFVSVKSFAQTTYETSKDTEDPNVKVLKGILTKYIIESDTSFSWYIPNQTMYTPEDSVLTAFKKAKDSVQFILFGGTWCETYNLFYLNSLNCRKKAALRIVQLLFSAWTETKKH